MSWVDRIVSPSICIVPLGVSSTSANRLQSGQPRCFDDAGRDEPAVAKEYVTLAERFMTTNPQPSAANLGQAGRRWWRTLKGEHFRCQRPTTGNVIPPPSPPAGGRYRMKDP